MKPPTLYQRDTRRDLFYSHGLAAVASIPSRAPRIRKSRLVNSDRRCQSSLRCHRRHHQNRRRRPRCPVSLNDCMSRFRLIPSSTQHATDLKLASSTFATASGPPPPPPPPPEPSPPPPTTGYRHCHHAPQLFLPSLSFSLSSLTS